jgi:hypothetical protein
MPFVAFSCLRLIEYNYQINPEKAKRKKKRQKLPLKTIKSQVPSRNLF